MKLPRLPDGLLARLLRFAPLGLFLAALWTVHEEVKASAFADFAVAWHSVPLGTVLAALVLTVVNFGVLAGYDWLGLRFAGHGQVPLRQVLFTSFLSYGISNTTGHAWASGGSIRYRYYQPLGVPGWDVAKVSFFLAITFMLGLVTLGAGAGLVVPGLPEGALANPKLVLTASVVCLGVLAAYWGALLLWRKPIPLKAFELRLPTPGMALAQMVVACVDLLLASLVLYVFVQDVPGMGLETFVVLFVMAQVLGLASQVPGGIGVFEGAFLWLAGPLFAQSHPQLVAGLVFYRVIYYFLPLAGAGVLLLWKDLAAGPERAVRIGRAASRLVPSIVPQVFAVLLFLTGGVLLVSGATPALPLYMHWLRDVMPLPVVEISHFAGSLVGVLLLFLARGVRLKLDAAWYGALILLGVGMVASLLKGLDWQEASVLAAMFSVMLLSRRHFYRKSSLLALTLTPTWLMMIFAMLVLTTWLGFFSYRHVEYTNDLWWQFSYHNDASRFLRSLVILCVAAVVLVVQQLLAPRPLVKKRATADDLGRALPLVLGSRDTQSHLALLGDKSLFWSDAGDAFVSFAMTPSYWIAMGDPVGNEKAFEAMLWRFREDADRHAAKVVFYQVSERYLPQYLDLGLALLKLGEEARVDLRKFSLEGSKRDNLRGGRNKVVKQGYAFAILEPAEAVGVMPRLKAISDAWMARKKVREKGFSLGFFDEAALAHCRIAVIRDTDGRIMAFANLWETQGKDELSVDLMRYDPDAVRGVMDYLFVELMLWGKAQEYRWFNLGMAPLAGLERHPLAPLWHKVGAMIFDFGEDLYNFEGLRGYKAKFDPEWRPRYLATPAGISAPLVLIAVARLISGSFKGMISK